MIWSPSSSSPLQVGRALIHPPTLRGWLGNPWNKFRLLHSPLPFWKLCSLAGCRGHCWGKRAAAGSSISPSCLEPTVNFCLWQGSVVTQNASSVTAASCTSVCALTELGIGHIQGVDFEYLCTFQSRAWLGTSYSSLRTAPIYT